MRSTLRLRPSGALNILASFRFRRLLGAGVLLLLLLLPLPVFTVHGDHGTRSEPAWNPAAGDDQSVIGNGDIGNPGTGCGGQGDDDDDDDDDPPGDEDDGKACEKEKGKKNGVDLETGRQFYRVHGLNLGLSTDGISICSTINSDVDYISPPVNGKKTALSVGLFVKLVTGPTQTLEVHGDAEGTVVFTQDAGNADLYLKPGGGRQFVLHLPGPDEWMLVTPGVQEVTFHPIGSEFTGRIRQIRDVRTGQVHEFVYITDPNQGGTEKRIGQIDLNKGSGLEERRVKFAYDIDYGILTSATESWQPVAQGAWKNRQKIEYVYFTMANEWPGTPLLPLSLDVGPEQVVPVNDMEGWGVLAMTVHHARSSHPSDASEVRVRQYRYHGPFQTEQQAGFDFDWQGQPGQLKLVIEPAQIAWAHQRYREADLQNNTLDVVTFALSLLKLADNDLVPGVPELRIVDLASIINEQYDVAVEDRVSRQHVLGSSCGCGTSADAWTRFEYEYYTFTGGNTSTKVSQFVGDAVNPYRIEYYDFKTFVEAGGDTRLMTQAIVDPGPSGRQWVTHYEYDSLGRQRLAITPAALVSYQPSDPNTAPIYAGSATVGLVFVTDYNANNRVSRRSVREGIPSLGPVFENPCTDCLVVKERFFGEEAGQEWTITNSRDEYLSQIIEYRTAPSAPEYDPARDRIIRKFFYGFFPGESEIAWIETRVSAETPAENGPGGWYSTYSIKDLFGRPAWDVAADGAITERGYDLRSQVNSITQNAPHPPVEELPNSYYGLETAEFGRDGDGGSLTTIISVGVETIVILPSGQTRKTLYRPEIAPPAPGAIDSGMSVLATDIKDAVFIDPPPRPRQRTWTNHGGLVVARGTFPGSVNDPPLESALSLEVFVHNLSGQVLEHYVWHDLDPATERYDKTENRYDVRGRLEFVINSNGTVQQNIYDDVTDRVIAMRVGIVDGTGEPTGMTTIEERFYDHFMDVSNEPQQGVGNGILTLVRQSVDADPANARTSESIYDWRGRPIKTVNPESPHSFVVYNNLDRPIKQAQFGVLPAGNDPEDIDTNLSDRFSYGETAYSQRGLVYRDRRSLDPGMLLSGFLETHTWYDEVGRAVGTWAPSGQAAKTSYDGLGRSIESYVTDRGGDADPDEGAPPPTIYSDVYDAATHRANITGDTVPQQRSIQYLDGRGLVDLVTVRELSHVLNSSVFLYTASEYSAEGRETLSINFGTNDDAGFVTNTQAPVKDAFCDWVIDPGALVTSTEYDERGAVESLTGPDGIKTKFEYDDRGRRIAVIENFDDGNIVWDENLIPPRWSASGVGNGLGIDDDRITSFVYDGNGNVVVQTAHTPLAVNDQVTEYRYVADVNDPGPSHLESNDLLRAVIYPGSINEPAEDRTTYFAYNRQAEIVYTKDQNGTEHELDRDLVGRVELDRVTAFGSDIVPPFTIDDTVKSIGTTYDSAGRVTLVTSFNSLQSPDPGVVNEIEFTYDERGMIVALWQEPSGAVIKPPGLPGEVASTKIGYTYATQPMGNIPMPSTNYVRLQDLVYSDGSLLTSVYGAGLNDRLSRVNGLDLTGIGPLVRYEYIGTQRLAIVDLLGGPNRELDVQLDMTASHNGRRHYDGYIGDPERENPGVYPGFDRFGRVVRTMWLDFDYSTHNSASPEGDPFPALPWKPPIVEYEYTNDQMSNRTRRSNDNTSLGEWPVIDEEFAYDGLYRLTKSWRGKRTTGAHGDWIEANFEGFDPTTQDWTLDNLGNWATVQSEASYSVGGGLVFGTAEDRTHNKVNEILTRVVDPPTNGVDFDHVGNMLRDNMSGFTYTHDAWNRLVRVETAGGTIGEYEYNGLNWRTVKRSDADRLDGVDELNEQRVMYYSSAWQLLEEEVYDDASFVGGIPVLGEITRRIQYVWGNRYIDDIVTRRFSDIPTNDDPVVTYEETRYHLTDAQFSTVAVLDEDRKLVERVAYTPYGVARHHSMADVNGNGWTEFGDQTLILANWGNPDGESVGDLNRDGMVDFGDTLMWIGDNTENVEDGALSFSTEDNVLGYAGYVFDAENQHYTVRNRNYSPELGRWIERDPAGDVDGANRYQYARGGPLVGTDPSGRWLGDDHFRLTKQNMRWWGFKSWVAGEAAQANVEVDWLPWTTPLLSGNYNIHFDFSGGKTAVNRNTIRAFATDTRGVWSAAKITASNALCAKGKGLRAMGELGRALHAVQDYYAHGNWDPLGSRVHPDWYDDRPDKDGSGLQGIPIRSVDDHLDRYGETGPEHAYRINSANEGKGLPGTRRFAGADDHTFAVLSNWIARNAAAGNCKCLCKVMKSKFLPAACGGPIAGNAPRSPPSVAVTGFTLTFP